MLIIFSFLDIHGTPPGLAGVVVIAYKVMILYLGLAVVNLLNAFYWLVLKRSKNGFVRLDKVLELHIFKPKNETQFAIRVTRALEKAKEKGYLIEFTTDHYTYGQIIAMFGEAVVSIKPAHPFTSIGDEFYKILFRVKRNNQRHYLTTVIEPSMLVPRTSNKTLACQ